MIEKLGIKGIAKSNIVKRLYTNNVIFRDGGRPPGFACNQSNKKNVDSVY